MVEIKPTARSLEIFKQELWKDQRRLDKVSLKGNQCLQKYFSSREEADTEFKIMKGIERTIGSDIVPEIIDRSANWLAFRYIEGIRLFNLLVDLDLVPQDISDRAFHAKRYLVDRCIERQRAIQGFLYEHREVSAKPYPFAGKINSLLELLCDVAGFSYDKDRLARELQFLDDKWKELVLVPFRDAAPKNMALSFAPFWIGNFKDEEERRLYIQSSLRSDEQPEWLDAPILDFDFCSCVELTTPEDDPISLQFHERTWKHPPSDRQELLWLDVPADDMRAAITFLLRYYRFGGRKAAYRLLHPWGHRVRFRYDHDEFYFRRLPDLVKKFWPDAIEKIPTLLEVTEMLPDTLGNKRQQIDHFISSHLGERRTYYVDMYPD